MSDSNIRKDCCDTCAEADRNGGCKHEHAKGTGMLARCCPPGTKNDDGCSTCIPCDGHHLKGSAYFTSAADRITRLPQSHRTQGRKRRAKAKDPWRDSQ